MAAADKSVDQTGGMVHMLNYDGQRYSNMGQVIDWRTAGSFERPGTVAQHIQDAFSIRPPTGLPRTVFGINAAQRLALSQTRNVAPSISSLPKPQHAQPRIHMQTLVPQMSVKSTKQPTKERTIFRNILPKDGSVTKYITKQIDFTVRKNKRPVGRPRKDQHIESPANIIPQAKSITKDNTKPIQVSALTKKRRGRPPKNLTENLTKSSTNEEPTASLNVSRTHNSHMDLATNLNILSTLKRKVGRPKKQSVGHDVETPPATSPMKCKVGRPRKSIQGVFPVSLKKVGSTTGIKLMETENPPDSSIEEKIPNRKNYVEPIDDIIDIDEEAIVKEISDNSSADTLIAETTDPGRNMSEKHAKGPVGRPRKIPKKAIVKANMTELPSVLPQRQLLKHSRGRPRKNPAGGLLQRPYLKKHLHGIFKRPVGRPRKVKESASLEVSQVVYSDKGSTKESNKRLVVLMDDIMKTKRDCLHDPKKEVKGTNTGEKTCFVNVYENKAYNDKVKEDTTNDIQSDDKQSQYTEMLDKDSNKEGGFQVQKVQEDSDGISKTRSSFDDIQQQVDKTASLEPFQPKSKVHLPKSIRGEILEVAKKEGVEAAALFYGIAGSTIYKWRTKMKQGESGKLQCLNVSSGVVESASPSREVEKKIVGLDTEQEKQIIDWIKEQRQTNNNVTAEMIKVHALTVTIGKVPFFEASDEWLRSFIDRNNLSIILGI